ncbi:MAG: hypothetical protein Q7U10_08425 [Thermodesulfovibrionia bacterium]|nr:hypothetical protein [Thermodesulfovibrionia bacterium]
MKKIIVLLFAAALIFSVTACQKKEEEAAKPQAGSSGPIIADQSSTPVEKNAIPKEFQVVVPGPVKSGWTDVVLILKDKEMGKEKEYKVRIGEKFNVPDSDLVVKVGSFLPDLTIDGNIITSASNEAKNPSVGIVVYEKGSQIFPKSGKEWGWLYANLPTIHAFEHERFGLLLKEGIKN